MPDNDLWNFSLAPLRQAGHRAGDRPEPDEKAALAASVRDSVFGVRHAGGTGRMGDPADSGAVIGPADHVIGIDGLTVAEASVMRRLPSPKTKVPILMIAEKIADGIRAA